MTQYFKVCYTEDIGGTWVIRLMKERKLRDRVVEPVVDRASTKQEAINLAKDHRSGGTWFDADGEIDRIEVEKMDGGEDKVI
jgi:hypothetical protein